MNEVTNYGAGDDHTTRSATFTSTAMSDPLRKIRFRLLFSLEVFDRLAVLRISRSVREPAHWLPGQSTTGRRCTAITVPAAEIKQVADFFVVIPDVTSTDAK
jgi:hypothetical protein